MSIVFLFPGQGSQKVGMGLDLYEQTSIGKEMFEQINGIVSRDLTSIIFKGSEEELTQTKNTQIAIASVSVILTRLLEEKLKKKKIILKPFACCGHSLGELTAMWYSNVIALETLIKLIAFRGEVMQNAPAGGMAAVLNITTHQIQELLNKGDFKGKLVIANYNSPSQFVVSGDKETIHSLPAQIKELGGKAIILPVSGAFHSPLMKIPSEKFIEELNKLAKFNNPDMLIYQNYDGKSSKDSKNIIEKLKKQMTSPVLWTQSINNLVNDNASVFIEIGPGKVLTGLAKKINSNIECYNIYDLNSLNLFIEQYEHKLLSSKSP